jgi:two-component system, NtrC family, response regulator AtoC
MLIVIITPALLFKGGRFREDLYYRLNIVNIMIPPLRERKVEIPVFVEYFLNKFQRKYQKEVKPFPDSLLDEFMRHDWVGNVRELANLIERFVIVQNENEILQEMITLEKENRILGKKGMEGFDDDKAPLKEVQKASIRQVEAEIIYKTLQRTNWN